MALYRLGVSLMGAIATVLKGDTIWGHVVWGIARHEGDEAAQAFLEAQKSDSPPFAVSSAFVRGYVPVPIEPPKEHDETLTKEKYALIKKHKKLKYTPAYKYIDGVETMDAEEGKTPFKAARMAHVEINRITGAAEDGRLFETSQMWANDGSLDIYVASSYDSARVTQLVKWAFEGGYGAGASRGLGNITVDGEAAEVKPIAKVGGLRQANRSEATSMARYMALSPFALPAGDSSIKDLRADIFTRCGKVSNAMSAVPWKKSVVMYDEGATFSVDSAKPIETAGMIIGDVHVDKRVCQCALSPVIPIGDE